MCLLVQIVGAVFYISAIGRQFQCWKTECIAENEENGVLCLNRFLDCKSLELPERKYWANVTKVIKNCNWDDEEIDFKIGIFGDAFKSKAAMSGFVRKYLYCFWWGLNKLWYGCKSQATSKSCLQKLKYHICCDLEDLSCML